MQKFTITQKILSLGATYQIRGEGSEEVIMTAKGKILSFTPTVTVYSGEGTDGTPIATVKGNMWKTSFTITDKDAKELATVTCPLFNFLMKFSLSVNGTTYHVKKSLLSRSFTDGTKETDANLEISKELSLKDRFAVSAAEAIPAIVAILSGIIVDQKFFEK